MEEFFSSRNAHACRFGSLAFLVLLAASARATAAAPEVIWAAASHAGGFTRVAISPDGEIVATTGGQRSPPFGSISDLKIWRALDGRLLHTLPTSSTGIESLEFSRDGALLASIESLVIPNGPFELYVTARRTGDWSVAYRVKAHSVGPENVSGVAALSRDSTMLASASTGLGEFKLWKLADGSPIRTLPRLPRTVTSLAFSPAGDALAFAAGRILGARAPADGRDLWTLPAAYSFVAWSVAYSPDGERLVSGGIETQDVDPAAVPEELHRLKTWEPADGEALGEVGRIVIGFPTFSPAGDLVAALRNTNGTGLVRLWRADGKGMLRDLVHGGIVSSMAFFPDGQSLVSAGRNLSVWDVQGGTLTRASIHHHGEIVGVAFQPGGNLAASASEDSTLRLWEVGTGSLRNTLTRPAGPMLSIAMSPDGRTIAGGGSFQDLTIRIWSLETGTELRSLEPGGTNSIRALAFSPDGRLLASASAGLVELWSTADWTVARSLHTNAASLAFSPDSRFLAAAAGDSVSLWELPDGEVVQSPGRHAGFMTAIAFSPDGRSIASASEAGDVKIWAAPGLALVHGLEHIDGWVSSLAFSPDGKHLASAGGARAEGIVRGTVRIWEVSKGTEVEVYDRETAAHVSSIAYSPDGRYLFYGRTDATLVLARNPFSGSRVRFRRGDFNADGVVNLTDAISALLHLFRGGSSPPCLETADVDNGGRIDLADPIYLLNHLFLGGPPPAPPWSGEDPCGLDTDQQGSPGDLGCGTFAACASANV
jgi:WD40 repeat protein